MTKEEIEIEYKNSTPEEILQKYTKKELVDQYIRVIGCNPISSYNKIQLINTIYQHWGTINRAIKIHESYTGKKRGR